MKIVIVGSISFIEDMRDASDQLERMGNQVVLPPSAVLNQTKEYWNQVKADNPSEFTKVGRERNMKYFDEIKRADAILVMNLEKNGISGYIGANTLMEMAIAFEHGKKIFLLNSPQEGFIGEDELGYMNPTVLDSDLNKLKQ